MRRLRFVTIAPLVLASALSAARDARGDAPTTEPPAAAPPGPPPTYAVPPRPERPPPFAGDPERERLPRERQLDLGGSFLLVSRLSDAAEGGGDTGVGYEPALGFGVHMRIPVAEWLQVGAYFGGGDVGLTFAENALGAGEVTADDELSLLWFGTMIAPTLPLGERVRLWASLGLGWGRFEFPEMHARDATGAFTIAPRGSSFVEIPVGLGGGFEIIDDWLAIELGANVVPTVHREGTSFTSVQAIDGAGRKRSVGALPRSTVGFTPSIGLSLLL